MQKHLLRAQATKWAREATLSRATYPASGYLPTKSSGWETLLTQPDAHKGQSSPLSGDRAVLGPSIGLATGAAVGEDPGEAMGVDPGEATAGQAKYMLQANGASKYLQ